MNGGRTAGIMGAGLHAGRTEQQAPGLQRGARHSARREGIMGAGQQVQAAAVLRRLNGGRAAQGGWKALGAGGCAWAGAAGAQFK